MRRPDHREPCLVIGVVARLVNMHPQTLRYYEKLGLIRPSRTDGRIRLFSMQDDGVNPAGIKKILELADRIEELEAELEELRKKVPDAI
jgi:MerR family transcriptional regulator/heat shock protein HspR